VGPDAETDRNECVHCDSNHHRQRSCRTTSGGIHRCDVGRGSLNRTYELRRHLNINFQLLPLRSISMWNPKESFVPRTGLAFRHVYPQSESNRYCCWSSSIGFNAERANLMKSHALVMHPGPMNRGLEITAEVADSSASVVVEQVANGVSVRMAILYLFIAGNQEG